MRRIGYVLIALTVIGCSSKSGEITVYPLLCKGSIQNGSCRGHWLILKRTVYRISADKQAVSSLMLGTAAPPKKLSKCMVSDTENWRCSDPDGTSEKQMASGEFSVHIRNYAGSDIDKDYEMRTRYVSRLRYWLAEFKSWVKPPSEY
jgi:hypothetical protein